MKKSKEKNLILVGDIPPSATEVDMRGVFSQFGEIKKIYFHKFTHFNGENMNNEEKNQIGNYCLINFMRKMSVEKCIFSTVMFGGKHLLLLKVKPEEMNFLLKLNRKNKKKKTLQDHVKEQLAEEKEILANKNSENQDEEKGDESYVSETEESFDENYQEDESQKKLKNLIQHIYIAFKLKQDKTILTIIDQFFKNMRTGEPYIWAGESIVEAVKAVSIEDFSPELLLSEIGAKRVNIFKIKQIFFWIKTSLMIKNLESQNLMQHFVTFLKYVFRNTSFPTYSEETKNLIYSVFRINFVNSNYTFIESKISTENERNQHWMIFLLTMLQQSYYELAKIFYSYNEDFDDIVARFDNLLELVDKNEKQIYKEKMNKKREDFNIGEIFYHSKDYIVKAMKQCTNNLLTHKYYKTHRRRFVMDYIRSLKILLSLKSKRIFEFAGSEWIEKNISYLSLCQSFPNIFREIVLIRATYQLRKADYEAAILNLMDFLSAQSGMSKDDYNMAVDRIKKLAKYVQKPISRKLEQYLNIRGGKISFNRTNQIVMKLHMNSDIHAEFSSIKIYVKLIDSEGEEKILENEKFNHIVTEGNLVWEFVLNCPNLGSDFITFEKLEVEYLNTKYIILSNSKIELTNAIESLNFDIKAEGLHLLTNFKNSRGHSTVKSMLFHGRVNYGCVFFQVYCHDVDISLKMKLDTLNLVEFENDVELYGLDTSQKWSFSLGEREFSIPKTRENRFVLAFKFTPYSFIKTLATPVLDIKIECLIPCNKTIKKKVLKKKMRCFNSKVIKLTHEFRKDFHSFSVNNQLDIPLPLKSFKIGEDEKASDVYLRPGEVYSTFHYDQGDSEKIETKVSYKLNPDKIGMNPLFKEWFSSKESQFLQDIYKNFKTIFEDFKFKENLILVDLKDPYVNPILKLKIKNPKSANIGEIIKIVYTIEYLSEEKGYFVAQLDEGDDEEIAVFLNKTVYLLEFSEEEKIKEIVLEALITRSGVYRIPDLIITDFKERKVMLMNDVKVDRTESVQFVSVDAKDEIRCIMENNLFNQVEKINFDA